MGIHPVLIYVIRGQEPKFHWDGMKNEWSTYEYLNMGKIQVRAVYGYTEKKPFRPLWSRYEAVFAARGFKNISIIPRVLIDKPHLDFYKYLN